VLDWVLGHEDVAMKIQQLKAMVQLHGEGAGGLVLCGGGGRQRLIAYCSCMGSERVRGWCMHHACNGRVGWLVGWRVGRDCEFLQLQGKGQVRRACSG
jgi:hypothetical protein